MMNNNMDRPWFASYEPNVPRSVEIPNVTLNHFLAESTRKYPYNTATNFVLSYLARGLYTVGGKMTYQKLSEMVDRFANALYQLGVRKGDRVALMLPNSPHYVIAFFAAMRIGAIIVNNNPTYTARELKHQLVDSGSETIVLLNLFYPRLQEIRSETPVKRVIVAHIYDTLGPLSRFLVHAKQSKQPDWVDVSRDSSVYLFQHLLERYGPNPPAVEVLPEDIALLQYTGGTTGLPKAAMLTHRNLVANTVQVASWLTKTDYGAEKMMCAIPFFHVYGMTVAMIYGLYLGGELTIVPNPRELDHVMDVMQRERSTLFPGVPAMYIRIVNHPRINEYDLKSIKACISGSAPLPIEIQEKFGQITGGRLVEGFGMTELSPVSHCNPVFGKRKKGSIGIPLPDVDAKIIDLETGEDIPFGSDKEGELVVKGPMVMKGYWNRPEETEAAFTPDGWLRTGDICKVDEEGYFYIVDRKKDMMIASGYKVLPRDVEEVLFTHPKVLEAVVVGIPNPARGDDTIKAFIVLKPGETATADEIREYCKQHLAPYKVPREVEFRAELPKTMVGKVLRRVLVEEEKAKQAGAPVMETAGTPSASA
jgi:long-chain acyl-CoA synthetase